MSSIVKFNENSHYREKFEKNEFCNIIEADQVGQLNLLNFYSFLNPRFSVFCSSYII